MPKSRGNSSITLSVLDRLIDEEFKYTHEIPRSKLLQKLKEGVRRDLEWLLNTRHPVQSVAEGTQLANSLYMYGLPDITSLSVLSMRDRKFLTQSIQAAVAKFEPRIINVSVHLVTIGQDRVPSLRFVIEGLLRVDPSPEHVSFDTVLELSSGEYKVQGEPSAR